MTETITVAKSPFQAAWDALRNPADYNGALAAAGYACAMLEVAHGLGEKTKPGDKTDAGKQLADNNDRPEVDCYVAAARRSGFYFGRDPAGMLALFKFPPSPDPNK